MNIKGVFWEMVVCSGGGSRIQKWQMGEVGPVHHTAGPGRYAINILLIDRILLRLE